MRPLRLVHLALALARVLADNPKVAVTRFKNLPSKLFYFEDTTVRPVSKSTSKADSFFD